MPPRRRNVLGPASTPNALAADSRRRRLSGPRRQAQNLAASHCWVAMVSTGLLTTTPEKVTTPAMGARTAAPCGAARSTPRWPLSHGWPADQRHGPLGRACQAASPRRGRRAGEWPPSAMSGADARASARQPGSSRASGKQQDATTSRIRSSRKNVAHLSSVRPKTRCGAARREIVDKTARPALPVEG